MTPEEEAEFLERFKVAYDARNHTTIRSHREVNKVARIMMQAGCSLKDIYRLADQARAYHNLATIERKEESKQIGDIIVETKDRFEVYRSGHDGELPVTYGKTCHTLKDIKQLYPFAIVRKEGEK